MNTDKEQEKSEEYKRFEELARKALTTPKRERPEPKQKPREES